VSQSLAIYRGSWVYRPTVAFLKKLGGTTDLENALQRLEKLAREEAHTAIAESRQAIHGVDNRVMGVDNKVQDVQHTLKNVEGIMRRVAQGLGIDDGVGDNVTDGAATISN
jgi:hypothetical protein